MSSHSRLQLRDREKVCTTWMKIQSWLEKRWSGENYLLSLLSVDLSIGRGKASNQRKLVCKLSDALYIVLLLINSRSFGFSFLCGQLKRTKAIRLTILCDLILNYPQNHDENNLTLRTRGAVSFAALITLPTSRLPCPTKVGTCSRIWLQNPHLGRSHAHSIRHLGPHPRHRMHPRLHLRAARHCHRTSGGIQQGGNLACCQ